MTLKSGAGAATGTEWAYSDMKSETKRWRTNRIRGPPRTEGKDLRHVLYCVNLLVELNPIIIEITSK